jgi:riboflavin kinase / FMN adenylyltransferase
MPCVLTLGNFDGVHIGHRAILDTARRIADQHDARVCVVTFDPHPAAYLKPGSEPPRILPLAERRQRLLRAGADEVHVLETTPELLATEPEDFIEQLVHRYEPVAFVEGEGFRFGKGRRGDLALLERLGTRFGFRVHVQPPLMLRLSSPCEVRASSTLVRRLVGHGRVFDAAHVLSEPFSLTAPVVEGERRGRTLGFPTANLDADAIAPFIVPADGVYAGTAEVLPRDGDKAAPFPQPFAFPAAISVGIKPTFGRDRLTVETHLVGYEPAAGESLYGKTLRLTFARWLRDQYAFPGKEALQSQLLRDVERARMRVQPHPAA